MHIFDANTLRNLALVEALELVLPTLDGPIYVGRIVRNELRQGAKRFPQANLHRLTDPQWSAYAARFQSLDARLGQLGFETVEVTSASRRLGEFAFLACLLDEWVMEEGEAEAFTLAAYRGFTLYSDEWKVNEEAGAYVAGDFPCPYAGEVVPVHRQLTVHTTAWLLFEAIDKGTIATEQAEALYHEMRHIWPRHPGKTLAQLRSGDGTFW